MQTLINIDILVIELDLIEDQTFHFPCGGFGQNIKIFWADMNSSIHIDNKGKDILILGKGPTRGLGEHLLTAEKMYSINFTLTEKKFC